MQKERSNILVGDEVVFGEVIWDRPGHYMGGSFRQFGNPRPTGSRRITGKVIGDYYTHKDRGHHYFRIEILACEGFEPISVGKKVWRRGRKIYQGLISHQLGPTGHKRQNEASIKRQRHIAMVKRSLEAGKIEPKVGWAKIHRLNKREAGLF